MPCCRVAVQAEQQVLGADVVMAELQCHREGVAQHALGHRRRTAASSRPAPGFAIAVVAGRGRQLVWLTAVAASTWRTPDRGPYGFP